jgi:hypothetical protein
MQLTLENSAYDGRGKAGFEADEQLARSTGRQAAPLTKCVSGRSSRSSPEPSKRTRAAGSSREGRARRGLSCTTRLGSFGQFVCDGRASRACCRAPGCAKRSHEVQDSPRTIGPARRQQPGSSGEINCGQCDKEPWCVTRWRLGSTLCALTDSTRSRQSQL